MPSGDRLETAKLHNVGALKELHQLLEGVTDVDDGVWVDVSFFQKMTLQVSGITTATVQVRGSLDLSKPANNTDGFQIGANITADAVQEITTPVRWLKLKVSAFTTGTISALLHCIAP